MFFQIALLVALFGQKFGMFSRYLVNDPIFIEIKPCVNFVKIFSIIGIGSGKIQDGENVDIIRKRVPDG